MSNGVETDTRTVGYFIVGLQMISSYRYSPNVGLDERHICSNNNITTTGAYRVAQKPDHCPPRAK